MNLKEPYPTNYRFWPENHVRNVHRKRRRGQQDDDTKPNGTTAIVFLRYNNMLYTNFIDNNEMVIVEQSWMNVLPTLPDALERKVYGT